MKKRLIFFYVVFFLSAFYKIWREGLWTPLIQNVIPRKNKMSLETRMQILNPVSI